MVPFVVPLAVPSAEISFVPIPRSFRDRDGAIEAGFPFGGTKYWIMSLMKRRLPWWTVSGPIIPNCTQSLGLGFQGQLEQ